jgi:hypothetical protein
MEGHLHEGVAGDVGEEHPVDAGWQQMAFLRRLSGRVTNKKSIFVHLAADTSATSHIEVTECTPIIM